MWASYTVFGPASYYFEIQLNTATGKYRHRLRGTDDDWTNGYPDQKAIEAARDMKDWGQNG